MCAAVQGNDGVQYAASGGTAAVDSPREIIDSNTRTPGVRSTGTAVLAWKGWWSYPRHVTAAMMWYYYPSTSKNNYSYRER